MESKTATADRTRSHEERVALDAGPDVVWRALTDAEELARWFPLRATVEPGVGGSISLSWGEQGSETVAIEVWEPNRRLRTVDRRRDAAGRLVEIAVDYLIETEGGQTTLRVVHAGFGPAAEWDQEYEGTVRGWRYELRGLRHYLSRHAGVDRRVASAWARTSLSPEASYARVMGPEGLAGPDAAAGRAEGDPYRLEGAAGVFEGRVLLHRPPLDFSGTVSTLNDALLRYEFYGGNAKLWVATWGVAPTVVGELESRLRAIIGRVG
jgi:uncharacterized protein YndB with AHSA1/START domain